MVSGNEMAVKAAMNMVFKMFGIDAEQTKADILRAVSAILTFDTRLAEMERTQTQILEALRENDENGRRDEGVHGRIEYPIAAIREHSGGTVGEHCGAVEPGTVAHFATEHFERGGDVYANSDRDAS